MFPIVFGLFSCNSGFLFPVYSFVVLLLIDYLPRCSFSLRRHAFRPLAKCLMHTGTSKKNRIWWKSNFFSCNLFQKVKLSYIFRFITCNGKHFKLVMLHMTLKLQSAYRVSGAISHEPVCRSAYYFWRIMWSTKNEAPLSVQSRARVGMFETPALYFTSKFSFRLIQLHF